VAWSQSTLAKRAGLPRSLGFLNFANRLLPVGFTFIHRQHALVASDQVLAVFHDLLGIHLVLLQFQLRASSSSSLWVEVSLVLEESVRMNGRGRAVSPMAEQTRLSARQGEQRFQPRIFVR